MPSFLKLQLKGETWVAYPKGLCFPSRFARFYPFRGRGIVARILYSLNRLHLDRLLLRTVESAFEGTYSGLEDVAFFWPSRLRATDRFYGYRVQNGRIVEYLKFATSSTSRVQLAREVDNVRTIVAKTPKMFNLPTCRATEVQGDLMVARFDPLPDDAEDVPYVLPWIERVADCRHELEEYGFAHGDFCLHNMKACGDKLWVIDWEEMMRDAPSRLDEITFFVVSSFFCNHWSMERIWSECETRYMTDVQSTSVFIAVVKSMAARRIALGRNLLAMCEQKGKLSV